MYQHLKFLLDELGAQAAERGQILDCRHDRMLLHLSPIEKEFISQTCIDWDWNVGSAQLLRRLQMACILTMSEFIVCVHNKNPEEAQLILNDLFEMEFALLANLVRHLNSTNPVSIQISDILQEGCKRLCVDLCGNPALLLHNYLDALVPLVPEESMETLKNIHLKLLLSESSRSRVEFAVSQQKQWNDEIEVDSKSAYSSIITSIVAGHTGNCTFFQTLLDYSLKENFECWKFYLLFLRCVARSANEEYFAGEDNVKTMVKQFFKDQFRLFLETKDKSKFYAMMLNARQICEANEEIVGSYAAWYKGTIGEMKYLIKSDEFKFTMKTLIDMVALENDPNVLNTHINTYIPAPPLCNDSVLNYVQMCKSRLSYCSTRSANNNGDPDGSRRSDQMEVIEIE